MVGSLYKIISKLLAQRLKKVMGELIDESQSAFTSERQIVDGVFIANQCVDWLKKKRKEAILLKLDFQKAHDTIKWSFLEHILCCMGFGQKWIGCITQCVSTASMSILINGYPTKPFRLHRGLRQGDPLSPYLFIIVNEALIYLIKEARRIELTKGVEIGRNNIVISQLQFADDTLVFLPKCETSLSNYKRILRCYTLMTGLNINYTKSELISWTNDDV